MFSLAELASRLQGVLIGEAAHQVKAVASLDRASEHEISFLTDPKWKEKLNTTQAGCVLLSERLKDSYQGNRILVQDPYLAYAKVAQWLDPTPRQSCGISPQAVVSPEACIDPTAAIAAGVVIEAGVTIGPDVEIGANCVIGKNSAIGAGSKLYPNVTIYHEVKIGRLCIVHSGTVVGSDGFGYASENRSWVKIPQTGGVTIGDKVEIGANCCIDRGALNDTVIGDGVKIDNACHIAHNVEIGNHVAMAACTGIAGSTTIGDYVTLSGRSSIIGHLNIAAGTHVTACSLINKSIDKPGIYSSGTGMQENKQWRKNVARFRQLDDMAKQIKQLQKELQQLKENHRE